MLAAMAHKPRVRRNQVARQIEARFGRLLHVASTRIASTTRGTHGSSRSFVELLQVY
jgi:hypothetical protein